MLIYRLTTPIFAGDLSGLGAKRFGGRWNSPGNSMVYCGGSISLCALELACNSNGISSINTLQLCCLKLDEKVQIESISLSDLPIGWQQYPAPESTKFIGDQWIQNYSSLVLKVPSCIIPREFNYLLNPLHPKFAKQVAINWIEPFNLDPRLVQSV
jgi:RES domain-containing protein